MINKTKKLIYKTSFMFLLTLFLAAAFAPAGQVLAANKVEIDMTADTATLSEPQGGSNAVFADPTQNSFLIYFFAGIIILLAIVAAVVVVIVSGSAAIVAVEEDED